VGALEDSEATRDREAMAEDRLTKPATPRMKKKSNNNPTMVIVPPVRIPEEPGAVIPHAGICELTITHKFGLFQSRESRAACLNISTLISTSCSVIFRIRW
jgi:hypothetical protein